MHDEYARLAELLGLGAQLPEPEATIEVPGGVPHEAALGEVQRRTGVSLRDARVRVGVTRGHLLEVVVKIPLDERGDAETLQIASELYLEERCSSSLLDDWVASVAVDRIARTSGLMLVADRRSFSSDHPLEEAQILVSRGVEGIRSQLPEHVFARPTKEDDWTALEIPPTCEGIQSDRVYASTRFPEALKSALEGMPFSSRRFTLGKETFCWVSWRAEGAFDERLVLRERIESLITSDTPALLSGTGFGRERDYLDLWVALDWPGLPEFLATLSRKVEDLEFGVYDTPLSDHPLRWGGLSAASDTHQ